MRNNTNKPYTVNQISAEKPNVQRSDNELDGYIANSFNGGHNRTIAWKQVMAGERHKEYVMSLKIKMLTPLTPPMQQLKMTIRSYFVPNSRIWDNAEKFTAQKGGTAEIKIKEVPNLGGKTIPILQNEERDLYTSLMNTENWRNAFVSSYLPRMGTFQTSDDATDLQLILPKMSVLPLRGRIAIYNDFERNKEYESEIQEYKTDTVSNQEWASYLPYGNQVEKIANCNMRAKRENSYYTNYRTDIQGFEESYPPEDMSADKALITWSQWEHKIAETRSQAENAQRNDWDIIAEIRGSQLLTEGKVQLIGEKVFNLNYASVTQNAYNSSNAVQNSNFLVLGQQGAYSYTEVTMPVYAGMEFREEGYVHIIATVSAESVFESGIDRLELNVNALDQYRPDLVEEKHDVLYEIETGTSNILNIEPTKTIGFKRKFSEYFKLPNIISADMTNRNYYESSTVEQDDTRFNDTEIETQKTYQFFEEDRNYEIEPNGNIIYKKPWKDYTDLLINKNQAIRNSVEWQQGTSSEENESVTVKGQNQIFLVGKCILRADMPIDESIKSNYTTWGEH